MGNRISDKHAERLRERGLNSDLCESLGIHSHGNAIAFDYVVNGQVWNTKVRRAKGDMPWVQTGKDLKLWNLDCLALPPEPGETMVITEGEFDAVACIQAGMRRTVSVPNGAPSSGHETGGKRYSYLFRPDGQELLPEIQRFVDRGRVVLAVDGDEKGRWLRDELAMRIGDEKCFWVEWPSGCKDANDLLKAEDESFLANAIKCPNKMWNDEVGSLDDFLDRNVESFHTGIPNLNLKIEFPCFMVMMGPYHCGKSTFLRQLLWSLWKTHRWPFLLTCLEEPVKPRTQNAFRRLEIDKHPSNWTEEEMYRADREINRAAIFLVRPRASLLTPKHFFDRVELAVRRDGVRIIALDPVNELDHNVGKNETLYWANFIMDCKRLADEYRLLFIVSGHPAKDAYQRLSRGTMLRLIDMSGSANWGNKADHGLTFWQPDQADGRTLMHHEKSKDHDTMGAPGLYELKHHEGLRKFEITNQGWDLWKKREHNLDRNA